MSRAPMPADLEAILDDLRVGLVRRTDRQRRTRATAAMAFTAVLLAAVGTSTARHLASPPATTGSGGAGPALFAADGLFGCAEGLACWPGSRAELNLPKHRSSSTH